MGVLLLIALDVQAQPAAPATPIHGDARLVDFEYDEDKVYLVLTRPKRSTFIRFAPDEKIAYVSTGDSRNFDFTVAQGLDFMEVKPRFETTETNATVVTSRRTYHLVIRSGDDAARWYARVSWRHSRGVFTEGWARQGASGWAQSLSPSPSTQSGPPTAASAALMTHPMPHTAPGAPTARADTVRAPAPGTTASGELRTAGVPETVIPGEPVRLDSRALQQLHFDYRIVGEAAFRPQRVFDDGSFTYVMLPPGMQDMPALFRAEPSDPARMALVHYEVKAGTLVVHRLMPAFVLRLGRQEIRVERVRPQARPVGPFSRWSTERGDPELPMSWTHGHE
jgi:type IV secretion system protein VirB9